MKKGIGKDKIFAVLFIAVLLSVVLLIASILKMSNDLREFKVNLYVLCNEADICVANGPDGQYRISPDNLTALNSVMASTKGNFTLTEPKELSNVSFEFEHEKNQWILRISDVGNNRLKVKLDGPEQYTVYISNNKKYDEFVKIASEKGYHSANKKIGG